LYAFYESPRTLRPVVMGALILLFGLLGDIAAAEDDWLRSRGRAPTP
jgi:hypothetical protein